jgi:hypothetical protein
LFLSSSYSSFILHRHFSAFHIFLFSNPPRFLLLTIQMGTAAGSGSDKVINKALPFKF